MTITELADNARRASDAELEAFAAMPLLAMTRTLEELRPIPDLPKERSDHGNR